MRIIAITIFMLTGCASSSQREADLRAADNAMAAAQQSDQKQQGCAAPPFTQCGPDD